MDNRFDDQRLFLRAVADAKPLSERRHVPQRPPPRQRAQRIIEPAFQGLRLLAREDGSDEIYAGLATGVGAHVLQELLGGHVAYDRRLDLHGHRSDSAHALLCNFVSQACAGGTRCVLIITGYGKRFARGLAVLCEALPQWLSREPLRPHILAFCAAQSHDGGPGAFYVLLRRGEHPRCGGSR